MLKSHMNELKEQDEKKETPAIFSYVNDKIADRRKNLVWTLKSIFIVPVLSFSSTESEDIDCTEASCMCLFFLTRISSV